MCSRIRRYGEWLQLAHGGQSSRLDNRLLLRSNQTTEQFGVIRQVHSRVCPVAARQSGLVDPTNPVRKTSLNCPGRPLRKALTAAGGVQRGVKVSASSVVVHIVLAVIFTPRYKTDGFSSASTPVGAFVLCSRFVAT